MAKWLLRDQEAGLLKHLTIFVATIGWLWSSAVRAESWLCIAEESVGFHEESRTWKPSIFSTSSKIVIRPLNLTNADDLAFYNEISQNMTAEEKRLYQYSFSQPGYNLLDGLCDAISYSPNAIFCKDMSEGIPNEEIIVNLDLMRFQRYQPYGYIF